MIRLPPQPNLNLMHTQATTLCWLRRNTLLPLHWYPILQTDRSKTILEAFQMLFQPFTVKRQMTLSLAIWEVNRHLLCIPIFGWWSLPIYNMGGPVTSPLVSLWGLNHHFLFNVALSTLCSAVDPQINRTMFVQLWRSTLCRFCMWPIDLLEIKSVQHISSLAAFDVLSTFEPYFAMYMLKQAKVQMWISLIRIGLIFHLCGLWRRLWAGVSLASNWMSICPLVLL